MEIKKTKQANLEKKRIIFFEYGIIIVLALILVAFESGNAVNHSEVEITSVIEKPVIELPPVTRPKPPLPPPLIMKFNIVEPNIEIVEPDLKFTAESGINDILPPFLWEKKEEKIEEYNYIYNPEQHPTFQGGDIEKFRIWVQKNISYSEDALRLRLQGRVTVKFIIDEKGNLIMPEVLRSVDPLLDNEVIKTLKKSPKWKPGKQHMMPVKVAYVIPVYFKIK